MPKPDHLLPLCWPCADSVLQIHQMQAWRQQTERVDDECSRRHRSRCQCICSQHLWIFLHLFTVCDRAKHVPTPRLESATSCILHCDGLRGEGQCAVGAVHWVLTTCCRWRHAKASALWVQYRCLSSCAVQRRVFLSCTCTYYRGCCSCASLIQRRLCVAVRASLLGHAAATATTPLPQYNEHISRSPPPPNMQHNTPLPYPQPHAHMPDPAATPLGHPAVLDAGSVSHTCYTLT